ncbi:MAG TPA: OB-fold nucleic acid binding domain-containing protein [Gemmataceae bacterium]|nr:OB-fold nucleic acid binding domain-containing protein [Gemmataceae bacterium]
MKGVAVEPARFAPFQPSKVLYDFDGPRTLTFLGNDGELYLALWFDENREAVRYLVVPFSEPLVQRLETGQISVREALEQPRLWVVDIDNLGKPVMATRTTLADLAQDELPVPGTMLLPSLEPLLSLRAIGEPIQAGRVPGSVIRFAIEGPQKAIKVLAEHALNVRQQAGRPLRALKRLYDLPTQSVRFASFEVRFRSPLSEPNLFEGLTIAEVQEETSALDQVGQLLRAGLDWLSAGGSIGGKLPVPNDLETSRAIVRALKHITPSSHGAIRELELRGSLVQSMAAPFRLDRDARAVVNATLRRFPTPTERSVRLVGRVRELDADSLRFELRDIEGEMTMRQCFFDEELWDDVRDLLGEEDRVEVLGVETSPTSSVRVAFIGRLPQ